MKHLRIVRAIALPLVLMALGAAGQSCSSGGSGGGAGTTGHAGTTGSAGTTGNAGTVGSAGTTGSAGTGVAGTTGTGGTIATGGSSGGDANQGGTGGTGGDTGGSGGSSGGTGGRGGVGGASGGSGGHTGGSGGSGNSTADGGVTDAAVHDGPTMSGGAYVRTGWTATYTCTGTCPMVMTVDKNDVDTGRAFDGMSGTRWSTGQFQQTQSLMSVFPLYFTFDMKQVNIVSKITTAAGGDPYDAPGEMDVLVSLDGTTFTTALTAHRPTSPSTGMSDTITFMQPTPARFIQLKATKTIKQVDSKLADKYWAIAELNVFPSP